MQNRPPSPHPVPQLLSNHTSPCSMSSVRASTSWPPRTDPLTVTRPPAPGLSIDVYQFMPTMTGPACNAVSIARRLNACW